MTTTLINPISPHAARTGTFTNVRADVRAAHLEAAALIAELDLDTRRRWRRVDRVVVELAAAAYDLAAAVTSTPPGVVAACVPPVVRVRELASAQRRLFAAMDRHTDTDRELLAGAAQQVRLLVERLRPEVGPWPSRQ